MVECCEDTVQFTMLVSNVDEMYIVQLTIMINICFPKKN